MDGQRLPPENDIMITIYHLDTSRSERIVWLMEELDLPYELELYLRQPNGAAPDG